VAVGNWQQRVTLWLQRRWRGVKGWLRQERSKILVVAVAAVALAALTALLWPTIQRTVGSGTYKVSPFGAAAFVAVTFSVIGALVYRVAKKTLWDLLELLIVPLALAGIGLWFTAQQDARQQQIEDQRSQDAVLQAYLDQVGALMLDENLGAPKGDDRARILATARTAAVLDNLDADHKSRVMTFLERSKLVQAGEHPGEAAQSYAEGYHEEGGSPFEGLLCWGIGTSSGVPVEPPVISLEGAALQGVNMRPGSSLEGADLRDAKMSGATLPDVFLSNADLEEADLSDDHMFSACLDWADLSGANLSGANLSGANLHRADLRGADLFYADLSGVLGVTNEELEQQALSLTEATMPNGQKYEDWLKEPN